LERIEQSAFSWTSLRSILIPRTVIFLGANCFSCISELRSLVFESGSMLKEMSEEAFAWTGVAELPVPSSVEVIGVSCFCYCLSLDWVGFESGSQLRRIGSRAFTGTPLTEVELPNSVRSISGSAFDRELLEWISIHSCPTNFRVRDGMLEDASGRVLIFFLGSAVSVVIRRSAQTIGECCFARHDTLMSVSFESDSALERIGESAFANGKLTGGIVLPRSVRVLAGSCFYKCESLTSGAFESGSVLSEIGECAFRESRLRSIVIPASVRMIGEYAFALCYSLASVTFEEESNLREIGNAVFLRCLCEGRVKIPRPLVEDGTKMEKETTATV
jgi:hypothetical protein